jgi:DNA-binding NarL/FixJ family response regulator
MSRPASALLRQSQDLERDHEEGLPRVTRVLIISPVRLYREGVALLLSRYPGVEVVGEADDAEAALAEVFVEGGEPDVVLLDTMTEGNEQQIRLLREQSPGQALLGMTVPCSEEKVVELVEAGASGFVTIDASSDELVAAIESAARSEAIFSPSMAAVLVRRLATLARDRAPVGTVEALTAREQEIVSLIEEGLSNKQIAQRLRIQLSTVKNHVHHVLGKLGLERRAQVVALARSRRR